MVTLLLALLSCEESAVPDPDKPPPLVPRAEGGFHLDLDEAGGVKGAPAGMVFHFPPGAGVDAWTGPLSDGSKGFHFEVRSESNAVVCTPDLPLEGLSRMQVRWRVLNIDPGPQKFMGINVELRNHSETGELISPESGRYSVLKNVRSPGDWNTFDAAVVPLDGAVTGEFCFRFVRSTGTIEVDSIDLGSGTGEPGPDEAGADPAAGAEADPAGEPSNADPADPTADGTCPPCPCLETPATPPAPAGDGGKAKIELPTKVSGGGGRWTLDEPGGAHGAPAGFDFILPPQGASTTIGDLGGATGFRLQTTIEASKAAACSLDFVPTPRMAAYGRVRVVDVTRQDKGGAGFATEIRAWAASGELVSPSTGKYVRLHTAQAPGSWVEFKKVFETPAGAVKARICTRFADAMGTGEVDWLAVVPVED